MTESSSPEPASQGKKVSTGVKLLVGCLGLAAVGMIVLAIGVAVGGFALKRTVESALGGFDEHEEASEILKALEAEHPFEVPDDGIVTEDQLVRFLEATDVTVDEMGSWATETASLGDRASGEEPGLGDLIRGAKSLAGGARARIVLAESLEDARMSLGEYVWVGLTMDRAAGATARSTAPAGIPATNLQLVDRYGPRIPRLSENRSADVEPPSGRGSVLAAAVIWGMTEVPTWHAMGLDTMGIGLGN